MSLDINLLREKSIFESTSPFGKLAGELEQVEKLGEKWRRLRRRLHIAAGVGIFTGIAFFFTLDLIFILSGVGLILLGIFLIRYAGKQGKGVANNVKRCATVKSIESTLRHDAVAHAHVDLKLSFEPKPEVLLDHKWPQRKNGREVFTKNEWLSMEATLMDGTVFSVKVEDLIRHRTYTNPRGKNKTKTRTHSMILQRFSYPRQRYGDLSRLGDRLRYEMQLPPSAALRSIQADNTQVKVKALVKEPGDLIRATRVLALGVYRTLNLVRKARVHAAGHHEGAAE